MLQIGSNFVLWTAFFTIGRLLPVNINIYAMGCHPYLKEPKWPSLFQTYSARTMIWDPLRRNKKFAAVSQTCQRKWKRAVAEVKAWTGFLGGKGRILFCDFSCFQETLCSCDDIVEELRPGRITRLVRQLLAYRPTPSRDHIISLCCLACFVLTCFLLYLYPLPS